MSSSLVESMSKSIGKDVAVFHKFLLEYEKYENTLFYFVEGDDFDYYNSRIKRFLTCKNIIDYSCDGKRNVINVRNLIKSKKFRIIDDNILKFFVDRDYGLDVVPDDIYVTDLYSIENFYVNYETIFNIIESVLKVNKNSSNYLKCQEYFTNAYAIYSKFAKQMNIFFYTIRKKEKEEKLVRTNFNSFKFVNFIENDDLQDFRLKILSFEELKEKYGLGFEIDALEFEQNSDLFDEDNHSNFRGKFELEFLKWFLKSVRESIKTGRNDFTKSRTCKYDFSTDYMLMLSDYAETPKSLIDYIQTNIFELESLD